MGVKVSTARLIQLFGLILISLAMTIFFNFSSFITSTVEENLQKYWRSSYDILVRPKQSNSFLDDRGQRLIEPNFLNGQLGGITLDQYETIRSIEGVDVAAPIATLGYYPIGVLIFSTPVLYHPKDPWVIYKDVRTVTVSDNVRTYHAEQTTYTIEDRVDSFSMDTNSPGRIILTDSKGNQYSVDGLMDVSDAIPTQIRLLGKEMSTTREGVPLEHNFNAQVDIFGLMVGIDPDQEQNLVNLEQKITQGRYLKTDDIQYFLDYGWTVPALVNENLFRNIVVSTKTYALDIPQSVNLPAKLHAQGAGYLDKLPVNNLLGETSSSIVDLYDSDVKSAITHDAYIGTLGGVFSFYVLPSPVNYSQVPQIGDYLLTLEVKPLGTSFASPFSTVQLEPPEVSFRKQETGDLLYSGPDMSRYQIAISPVGSFDYLSSEVDPLTRIPMETYTIPTATLKYDESGNLVENPVQILPTNNPTGYLSDTPLILVSLDSAHFIARRDDFISAIRIRVNGVDEISEDSQQRIENVAREIVDRTGLQVDITLGSSPQNVLIHVPGINNIPGLGYVEENWIRQLLGITIHREVNQENLFLFAAIFICSLMFVIINCKLNVVFQRKKIGILSGLGWEQKKIIADMNKNFFLFSITAIFFSVLISGAFYISGLAEFSFYRILMPIPFLLIVYFGGTLIETRKLLKSAPIYNITNQGKKETQDLPSSLSAKIGRIKTQVPAGLAVTFSAAMLVFIAAVIFQTINLISGSSLGQSILFIVRPYHYILVLIALLISGFCVFSTLFTQVITRRKEIGLLKAIGWQNEKIFWVFFKEGLSLNVFCGIAGSVIGILLFMFFYGSLPNEVPYLILIGVLVPCLMGCLTSFYPARLAIHLDASEILRSE